MNRNIRKMAVRYLIRKPGRTAALVILTALLALSVFGGSMVVASLRQGLKSLENRLGADIIVVPSSAQSKVSFKNMLLQGTTGAFYMSRENLARTLEVEGVEKAAAQVFLASLKADCCSIEIQVIGFDPDTDFIIQPWIAESYTKELGDLEVVVGTKVSAQVGEIIRIYDERCKVAARLAPTGTGLDTAVYCSMETMKKLLQAAEAKGISHKISGDEDGQISAIYVKVKEGYEIGKVNSAIQGHTRKASAIRTRSMLTDVSGSLSAIASTAAALIGLVWLLALIILVVAYAMIANERKKEFALLRLLGASRSMMKGLVRTESVLLSLAGGTAGILFASLLVFPFTTLIETSLGLPWLTPSLSRILLTAVLTLTGTVLAGSGAAALWTGRLCRSEPGTVLRENG